MTGRVRVAGEDALLVASDAPAALAAALRELPGVEDVLPAAETVLVTLRPGTNTAAVRRGIENAGPVVESTAAHTGPPIRIPVQYDGEDLTWVAAHLSMTVDEVVAAHTGRLWRCAFVGFAPGFGYLVPDSPGTDLAVPRREQSRVAIPPGAVALAGGFSAVYPRTSPGGWQLIGHTTVDLWDLERTVPALIRPGVRVGFEAL